jgi:GAF domain-containing protein
MAQDSRPAVKQPALDEEGFQRILAAAHLVQDHNDRVLARGPIQNPVGDPTQTLAAIVEVQNVVLTGNRNLLDSILLIADRTQRITRATGVAVAFHAENELVYWAGIGLVTGEVGSRAPLERSLSGECVETGEVLRYTDARSEAGSRSVLFRQRNVAGFIAVPIIHEQQVRAVLELRSPEPRTFPDYDLRTCQLMAGLITEVIAKATEAERKKALANERATMLEALERIKPELQRLVVESESRETDHEAATVPSEAASLTQDQSSVAQPPPPIRPTDGAAATHDVCRACGRVFEADEVYCGGCGTARRTEKSGAGLQSKWASLWHLQQAATARHTAKTEESASAADPKAAPKDDERIPLALQEVIATFPEKNKDEPEEAFHSGENDWYRSTPDVEERDKLDSILPPAASGAGIDNNSEGNYQSEALSVLKTSQELQKVAGAAPNDGLAVHNAPLTRQEWVPQLWQAHRSRIYLAAAAILFVLVLFGWGTHPAPNNVAASPSTVRHRRTPPKPQLTFFEGILVGLGLAEPPPTPVYLGNPETQVWLDSHTALYYCPGADLYGKTPDGKFVTQREAQQDQFEPAFRKPCD